MKIFMAYQHIDESWGGANNFQRVLCKYLQERKGFDFLQSSIGADIIFFNQLGRGPGSKNRRMFSARDIKSYKKNGAKVVIRAVNLFSVAYKNNFVHRFLDRRILEALAEADEVIFQSKYQREMFCAMGYKGVKDIIIHNGADGQVFTLFEHSPIVNGPLKLVSVSAATRASKRHDLIAKMSMVNDVEVCHVGQWPANMDLGNVRLLGHIDHHKLAELYKEFHGFFHPAEIDPCPNALIEAMSSGLPVIYNNGIGSSGELVGHGGVPLDSDALPETAKLFRDEYPLLIAAIAEKHEYFTIDRAMEEYYSVFQQLI